MTKRIDIAILTVIPIELKALRAALAISDVAGEKDPHGTIYYSTTIYSNPQKREYRLILTCIGMAGNPSAAAATADVVAKYNPHVVVLVGIAAGMRGKVKIGEVILGERVVAYEPAAQIRLADRASVEEPRPDIDRLSQTMQQDVVNYTIDTVRLTQMFAELGGVFPTSTVGLEQEYQQHVAQSIAVTISTIASGEKLLRDPAKLRSLRRLHGKTEVGEMEAAGFVTICRRHGVPWLVIRGISDFGDEFKNDTFHRFASQAAAVVLVDFLRYGLRLTHADESQMSTLRERIYNWLDEDELRNLCSAHFPQVYKQLTAGMSFDELVRRLVDFCRRKRQVARLLDLLEHTNPGLIGSDRAALLAQLGDLSGVAATPAT
jgi:nucleoside phosphorylase